MPSLNFTKFVDQVESGAKRCTIRARRKRPIRTGDKLHLFTGMRTNQCRRLKVVECTATTPIEILADQVVLCGQRLTPHYIAELAHRDGFSNAVAFLIYFNSRRAGLEPFRGDLIEWSR